MIETALTLRGMLDEDDYQSWPKVSRQGPTPDGAARFPDDDDAARMYYNQARRLFALATGAKDRGNVQFAERLTDVAARFLDEATTAARAAETNRQAPENG